MKQWGRSATRGFGASNNPRAEADGDVTRPICLSQRDNLAQELETTQIVAVVGSLVALAVGVGVGVGIKKAGWV